MAGDDIDDDDGDDVMVLDNRSRWLRAPLWSTVCRGVTVAPGEKELGPPLENEDVVDDEQAPPTLDTKLDNLDNESKFDDTGLVNMDFCNNRSLDGASVVGKDSGTRLANEKRLARLLLAAVDVLIAKNWGFKCMISLIDKFKKSNWKHLIKVYLDWIEV